MVNKKTYALLDKFSKGVYFCLRYLAESKIIMEHYGDYFKALREAKGMTLREVERKTEVSNAYLSQLESGKVKQPSPIYLHKLARLYGVSYELLMEKVGYPVPKPDETVSPSGKTVLAARVGTISREEEQELLEYLKFIRTRKR